MAPLWLLLIGLAALCSTLPTSSQDSPSGLDNLDLSIAPFNTTAAFTDPWQKTSFEFIGVSDACNRPFFSRQVNAALWDAITIAFGIDTDFADDDPIIEDYFDLQASKRKLGVDINEVRQQIKGNFARLQDTFRMGADNDALYARAVLITCGSTDDIAETPRRPTAQGCRKPHVRAHVTLPQDSLYQFPIISLCNSFFELANLTTVDERIAANRILAFDARSYESRGSAMLHELLHLPYPGLAAGISNPTAVDKALYGILLDGTPLLMYGAANAKMLARYTRGGADVAVQNVDNHVYAALASYGSKKYGVDVILPAPGWSIGTDELVVVPGNGTTSSGWNAVEVERDGVWDLPEEYYRVEAKDLLSQAEVDALH